ncbi:MAG: clan AA aspartic protease [Deltaproteobacteria bacterium]|nr:MAG: clan AA aspartic protease [Deltaproteobacteria bacterium]
MITGVVRDDRQAIVHLMVRGPAGQEQEIEAIIDTGFDGWLSLPSSLVVRLGLVWHRRGRALLADGSESVFDIYEATVDWDGEMRRIPVDEVETVPLLGMSLLEGYELTVQVQPGGNVTIRAL